MVSAPFAPEFLEMLNDHQPRLRRVARLYCADADDRQDLYQEMVLQLWRAWPHYEARPEVQVGTWLYRVALNVAISDLRRRSRHPAAASLNGPDLPDLAAPPPEGPDPDDLAQLYRAIERLSNVEKAFVLLYLEERSYAEMADILGITQNNVRVKMHRVQDKLRQLLTQPA
ncbi:RNA polymerase sigma factor [Hymenobacter psychrophilus]|uniref:RNA polymerase sigma-70 factor, ECF subfamily n=1 Tax=Hymenobacter psychrophilus TaxID=651662 RepID=A0A1H3H7I1_9BACT|nr:sigma-70 family RNA polymerase sigma factor [Hymenobacter psychrophilus]SDY10609.1 RNA polymerase sigma-70 factor, ECF subfamily [Hymenobacter psychrophilus]